MTTIYTVTYRNWGADAASTAYFRTKTEATEFYSRREYADKPQAIRVKDATRYDSIIRFQQQAGF